MSKSVNSEKQELKRRRFFTVKRVSSDEQKLRVRTERAGKKKGRADRRKTVSMLSLSEATTCRRHGGSSRRARESNRRGRSRRLKQSVWTCRHA